MSTRRLWLLAASPLCFALSAHAETAISSSRSDPVATATANNGSPDNIHIESGGSVTTTSSPALAVNSDNNLTNEGAVSLTDVNNGVGVLIEGGHTSEFVNTGTIAVTESYVASDTNKDGVVDGVFASGSGRAGVRLTGTQPLNGSINLTGGSVSATGQDSAGVSIEAPLLGDFRSAAAISVVGERSYGVHITAPVSGSVVLTGSSTTATGPGATALSIAADVGGQVLIDQTITATGYRQTTRPTDAVIATMTADELQQGAPAAQISGTIAGGVLIAAPPATIDANIADANSDGLPDSSELTSALTSYGSAPALQIGGASVATRLGTVSSAYPYGLTLLGTVQGVGVYDGVATTALQIGGLGAAAGVDGGVYNYRNVTAASAKADSTALRIGGGGSVPLLANGGVISATSSYTAGVTARAIRIDQGGALGSIVNAGSIKAVISDGAAGSAIAVQDLSGSLAYIANTNLISATITPTDGSAPTGEQIALDLRSNTQGVTLLQSANPVSSITPSISGDVLFGTGSAKVSILAGSLTGAVAFGGTADSLTIDGGASVTGAITQAQGSLAVNVASGSLTDLSASAKTLSALSVGPNGALTITVDPQTPGAVQYTVNGVASLAGGAKLGVRTATKLTDPTTFTIIRASDLNAAGLQDLQVASVPYLNVLTLRVDDSANAVFADVRRRTTTELGLTKGEADAYDAIYANFDRETAVKTALLSKTDQAGFTALYDQLMPSSGLGIFDSLVMAQASAGRVLDGVSLISDAYPTRVWLQEVAFRINRKDDRYDRYSAFGDGLSGGFELYDGNFWSLGLQGMFIAMDVDEAGRVGSSDLSGSVANGGIYLRSNSSRWIVALSASGGFASMKSTRQIVDDGSNLNLTAKAKWSGVTGAAHAAFGYRAQLSRFYVEPKASSDLVILKEGRRTESGGGDAIDVQVDSRTSNVIRNFVGVSLGADLVRNEQHSQGADLTLGWRQDAGKGLGDTEGRFVAGGPDFDISSPGAPKGAAVVRAALRGQSRYLDLALEAGGEFASNYQGYDARVSARFPF